MQLPVISRADFLEYLDFQFEATGKPIDEQALELPASTPRARTPAAPSSSPGSAGRAPRPAQPVDAGAR